MKNEGQAESQESRINAGISLRKEAFSRSQGIFVEVFKGEITSIVKRFNIKSTQNDPDNDSGII